MEPVVTEELIARQPPEAQAIIRLLLATIAKLEARIEELQRQLKGKTPQNSSLPPGSQHPHAKPPRQRRKSKKKRGGQPGHKKHERPLIPTDECNDVQPPKPTECRRCGHKLSGNARGAGPPGRPTASHRGQNDRRAFPCLGDGLPGGPAP